MFVKVGGVDRRWYRLWLEHVPLTSSTFTARANMIADTSQADRAAMAIRRGGRGKAVRRGNLLPPQCGLAGKTEDSESKEAGWESVVPERKAALGHAEHYINLGLGWQEAEPIGGKD